MTTPDYRQTLRSNYYLADDDEIAAEYDAYVASQHTELNQALTEAKTAVHRASRALIELIELDAPDLGDLDGGDALHALADAGRAIRTADLCHTHHLNPGHNGQN